MTFFLVRDFLEAAFPVQQGGLLWLFAVGRGQRVQSCVVVKLLGGLGHELEASCLDCLHIQVCRAALDPAGCL